MDPTKKQQVRSQKKYKHFKDDNPIYLLESFDYNNKTHYAMSTTTMLYIGYMEKTTFNQIITYNVGAYACSFVMQGDVLYVGLKNGCVILVSMEKAYNQIPFRKIESVDGASVLGICVTINSEKQRLIYTVSQNSSIKLYKETGEEFKFVKSIALDSKIDKVVSKKPPPESKLPVLMIQLKNYHGYPILLTTEEIDDLLEKKTDLFALVKMREKGYFEDERLFATLTSMDFDPLKMIATLGYIDGQIEVHKINQTADNERFYFITPELRVKQRQNVISVSIIPDLQSSYISFVTGANFSAINYDKRSAPFARIKVEKDKEVTVVRWTRNKYFLAACLSTEERRIPPKMYCIEQDVVGVE